MDGSDNPASRISPRSNASFAIFRLASIGPTIWCFFNCGDWSRPIIKTEAELFDLLLKALPPETKKVFEQLPAQLQAWGALFIKIDAAVIEANETLARCEESAKRSDALMVEVHASVARVERMLAQSAVTVDIHESASQAAPLDPRNLYKKPLVELLNDLEVNPALLVEKKP
jgi:hypothetical protein